MDYATLSGQVKTLMNLLSALGYELDVKKCPTQVVDCFHFLV
jgi:hypothetical protein